MLILSRLLDEKIYVGDDVVLTIVDIRPGRVKLGIEAPLSLQVDRAEVREAKLREARNKPITDLAAHVKAVAVDAIKAVGKGAV